MVELNANAVSESSLLGVPAGTLDLRIHGSALDGRVVRVRSQKCTIGSAAECGIRLRSPDARPVHCVILRGRRGVLVRRWAADTLLNGQAFQEAWLEPGDRLTVGAIEFDVLESTAEDDSDSEVDFIPEQDSSGWEPRRRRPQRFGRRDFPNSPGPTTPGRHDNNQWAQRIDQLEKDLDRVEDDVEDLIRNVEADEARADENQGTATTDADNEAVFHTNFGNTDDRNTDDDNNVGETADAAFEADACNAGDDCNAECVVPPCEDSVRDSSEPPPHSSEFTAGTSCETAPLAGEIAATDFENDLVTSGEPYEVDDWEAAQEWEAVEEWQAPSEMEEEGVDATPADAANLEADAAAIWNEQWARQQAEFETQASVWREDRAELVKMIEEVRSQLNDVAEHPEHDGEVDQLRDEIHAQAERIESLKIESEANRRIAESLAEHECLLQQQQELAENNETRLRIEIAELTRELADLRESVEHAEPHFDQIELLNEQLLFKDDAIQRLENEKRQLETQLNHVAAESAERQVELELTQERLGQLESELNSLSVQVSDEREHYESLLAASKEKAIRRREEFETRLREVTEQAAAEVSEYETRLTEANKEAALRQAEFQDRLASLDDQTATRLQDLEHQLRQAADQEKALEEAFETRYSLTLDRAAGQRERLEDKIAELEKRAADQREELERRQSEINEQQQRADQENRRAVEAMHDREEMIQQLLAEKKASENELERLRKEAADWAVKDAQLESLQAKQTETNQTHEQLMRQVEQLREELESRNELVEQLQSSTEMESKLRTQLDVALEQIDEQTHWGEEVVAELEQQREQIEQMRGEISEREGRLETAEAALNSAEARLTQQDASNTAEYQRVVSELTTELQAAQQELESQQTVHEAEKETFQAKLQSDEELTQRLAEVETQLTEQRSQWESDRAWFEQELEARTQATELTQQEKQHIEQQLIDAQQERDQLELALLELRQHVVDPASASPSPAHAADIQSADMQSADIPSSDVAPAEETPTAETATETNGGETNEGETSQSGTPANETKASAAPSKEVAPTTESPQAAQQNRQDPQLDAVGSFLDAWREAENAPEERGGAPESSAPEHTADEPNSSEPAVSDPEVSDPALSSPEELANESQEETQPTDEESPTFSTDEYSAASDESLTRGLELDTPYDLDALHMNSAPIREAGAGELEGGIDSAPPETPMPVDASALAEQAEAMDDELGALGGGAFDAPEAIAEEDLAFEPPSDAAPVSTADILAKFGCDVDDESQSTPPMMDSPMLAAEPARPEPVMPTPAMPEPSADRWQEAIAEDSGVPKAGEEDDIADYMDSLLRRMRGSNEDDLDDRPYSQSVAPQPQTQAPAKPSPVAAEPQEALLKPEEYTPRTSAPERDVHLAEMRALANRQTHNALGAHEQRNWAQSAQAKLAGSAILFFVAGAVLYFAGLSSPYALGAALISIGVAMIWLTQAYSFTRNSRRILFHGDEHEVATEPKPVVDAPVDEARLDRMLPAMEAANDGDASAALESETASAPHTSDSHSAGASNAKIDSIEQMDDFEEKLLGR